MGHDFIFIHREGLPVQAPDWREGDTPAWQEAWRRYWDATPEARGHWSCSYDWSAQLAQALTDTGVLIEVERSHMKPQPAKVYADEEQEELTPEGRAYLSQAAGQAFRVPAFKLDGNPWIFSPSECAWMAYALRPHPDPDMQAFGRFCEAAARHGGLMVG